MYQSTQQRKKGPRNYCARVIILRHLDIRFLLMVYTFICRDRFFWWGNPVFFRYLREWTEDDTEEACPIDSKSGTFPTFYTLLVQIQSSRANPRNQSLHYVRLLPRCSMRFINASLIKSPAIVASLFTQAKEETNPPADTNI